MRRQKGFTLIELLIVVAIIGIIAAIAIPNLLNAINRGRQKRTMADMRTIATAIGAYGTDNSFYPRGRTSISALSPYISPTYIKTFPMKDGWNNTYQFQSSAAGANYTIRSYTKDRIASADPTEVTITKDFDCDIILTDGTFVEYPEGTQN